MRLFVQELKGISAEVKSWLTDDLPTELREEVEKNILENNSTCVDDSAAFVKSLYLPALKAGDIR